MSLPSSLLQNSEWMAVAVAVAVLVIVWFVLLAVLSRKISRLAKNVEKLAREVDELHSLEHRRLLKELNAKHSPGEKIEAPPLAYFTEGPPLQRASDVARSADRSDMTPRKNTRSAQH